jgi:iron complex outermembrane receptor protein
MFKKISKTDLLLGVAFSTLFIASPAFAQAKEEAGVDDTAIIVTARRIEENLQNVPISITVYDQQQLTKRNIAIASDLATYTPSLAVDQRYGPEKSAFAIRGFVQESSTAPTVGVYFADVIGVRAQGGTPSGNTVGAGSFTDLQNVQVLKGPQGTLFGRNTTGGAILLVPQKPTSDLEGYFEGTYGNYDQKRVQAALNIPLGESFRVRLATDINRRDGFMINRSGVGPDAYNNINYDYFRLSIVGDLTDNVENYTIATYSKSSTNGYASHYVGCDRNAVSPLQGGSLVFYATATAACDQVDRQKARGDGPYDVDVGFPDPNIHLRTWQAINTTTWQASDALTVKNIVSYGQFREDAAYALSSDNYFVSNKLAQVGQILKLFGAPVNIAPAGTHFGYVELDRQPGFHAAAQSTFTEELQLQGKTADGRFNYVVGGYLEFSRPIDWNQQRTGIFGDCADPGTLKCTAPLGFALVTQSRTKYAFDNHGIFAQGTFKVTEQLGLTLGGRWTFDKIVGVGQSSQITLAPIPGVGTIPVAQTCNDTLNHTGVNIIATGDSSQCETTIVNKSNRPTWLISLDYKPNSDLLFYAKYSRGYRQGGITFTNPGLETWKPEKVDAYEIGAKTSFHFSDVRGYFNISAFYNNFTDQQVFASLRPKPEFAQLLAGGAGIINAGRTTIQGIEIDSSATIARMLHLSAGYTYLDTKIKVLVTPTLAANAPFLTPIPRGKVGDPLTYSPKHRLTLTGSIDLPIPERLGNLSFGATYTYTSQQFSDTVLGATPGIDQLGQIAPSNLVNLNVDWKNAFGGPVDLALFAINVTNSLYEVGNGGGYLTSGSGDKLYGAPRMYGVRLRYSFGNKSK